MTVSKQTKPKEVTQSVEKIYKFVAQLAESDTPAFKSWTQIKSLGHCSFYVLEACHLGYDMFQFDQFYQLIHVMPYIKIFNLTLKAYSVGLVTYD